MATREHLLRLMAGLSAVSDALEDMAKTELQDGNNVEAALLGGLHNHSKYILVSAAAAAEALARQKPERHPLDIWKGQN